MAQLVHLDGSRFVEGPDGLLHHDHEELLDHGLSSMALAFYDDHEDDQSHHHVKKSVLAMVKEKARRWRQRLAKKRRGHDEESVGGSSTTPSWGVSLEEYEEDNEEDPEYHGAPMYESELAPDEYKEATQHTPVTVVLPDKPILDSIAVREETITVDDTGDSKTITETVSEMLAPAYAVVSDATQMLASKIQSDPGQSSERGGSDETTGSQLWDKGVSVKEYLMQKLEPGEEERALSQVISDTISPKKGGADGEVGVMEKLRETVASMLVADDGVDSSDFRDELSKRSLLGVGETTSSDPIPVSMNPYGDLLEETEGRRLQTN